PGNEELPDAARAARSHGVTAAIPAIEVADDAHALGIRRPHRKSCAGYGFALHRDRAQRPPRLVKASGIEQEQIVLRDLGGECISVERFTRATVLIEAYAPGPGRRLRAA